MGTGDSMASDMDALATATTWDDALNITKKAVVEADKCMVTHRFAWMPHFTSYVDMLADAEEVGQDGSRRDGVCARILQGYDDMIAIVEAETKETPIINAAAVKRLMFQRNVLARLQPYMGLPSACA